MTTDSGAGGRMPAGTDQEATFHALVSNLDYPMYIVTAACGEQRAGCLVGFVTQASLDPQRLVVMLSKANFTYRVVKETKEVVVHFLGAGNLDLAARFGEETGDDTDKFAGCHYGLTAAGTPVLTETRGVVVGDIRARLDCGDHVAHLLDVRSAREDGPGRPLSYQEVKTLDPGHPA